MLTYKLIPTSDLIPYARNSRTHSEAQVTKIASSIKEFGFINPVVTDGKNGIVAGHGRVMAASKLGLKEIPCVEASHLTEAQKRAYVIADNRMALDAGWDIDLLKVELGDLQGMDFDLALTGFDPGELENFLAEKTEGLTDPDAVPDTPARAVTVPGDVWVMGKHRLMCGDSTSIDAVDKLMAGGKADMVFTDPPYGINIGGQSQGKGGGLARKIDYGINEWDKEIPYEAISVSLTLADAVILWGANYYADKLPPSSCWIAWDKDNGATDFADVELAWTSYTKAARLFKWKWAGMLQQDMKNKEARVHPTQKPIALAEWAFENFAAGHVIVDLFGGSGSTLIACEKTNRECRIMELDPKYCDVTVKRWQDFTGQKAILESTGRTFEDMASDRYSPAKDGEGSYMDAIAAKREELEATS